MNKKIKKMSIYKQLPSIPLDTEPIKVAVEEDIVRVVGVRTVNFYGVLMYLLKEDKLPKMKGIDFSEYVEATFSNNSEVTSRAKLTFGVEYLFIYNIVNLNNHTRGLLKALINTYKYSSDIKFVGVVSDTPINLKS